MKRNFLPLSFVLFPSSLFCIIKCKMSSDALVALRLIAPQCLAVSLPVPVYMPSSAPPQPLPQPHSSPAGNLPPWRVPQSAESAVPHLVFSLMGFTSLSNCEIIQTSQSHPPCEQRVTSLSSPQSLTPRAMAGFLYSQVQSLHGPTWLVASSSSSL